jgi:hypothetical protein
VQCPASDSFAKDVQLLPVDLEGAIDTSWMLSQPDAAVVVFATENVAGKSEVNRFC